MKMTSSDYIFQLCQSGFGNFPNISKTPLVDAVRFSNSMAKFDRFHSGKALTTDLDGAEAEKKYLARQWNKRRN
jgi:hypothetical protein